MKGAFTGAHRTRVGRFEAANGGDLFLDEVGDIPLGTQVKLLRVLEEKEIERVGDHKPIRVDVRIITATNKDLEVLIAKGAFREDLFYRISAIPVRVPPLRERKGDIPVLAQAFCEKISLKGPKSITTISPKAMEILLAYSWPGNVRELQNTVEHAFVLCQGKAIGPEHLPSKLSSSSQRVEDGEAMLPTVRPAPGTRGKTTSEKERLVEALLSTRGHQARAAKLLGISRVTLWKWMKKYGVSAKYS